MSDMPCHTTQNKVENYIGCVPIPVGLSGPHLLDGEYAKGAFYVPMATLEGTLVASYTRGARMIAQSALKLGTNGIEASVVTDGFIRGGE